MGANLFLNTNVKGCGRLEDAANFMLAPVRALFHGKTVDLVSPPNSGNVKDSFTHLSGWTKFLAAVALPISIIVGSILKGISHLYQETRERNETASTYIRAEDMTNQPQIAATQRTSNAVSTSFSASSEAGAKIRRGPLTQFLPEGFKSPLVSISAKKPLLSRIAEEDAEAAGSDPDRIRNVVAHQYVLIESPATPEQSLFAAIAAGSYNNQSPSSIQAMRSAVTAYLREHSDAFSNEIAFPESITGEEVRVSAIRRANRIEEGASGTEIELGFFAEIFGRPIHLIDCSQPLQVDENGLILPTRKFGDRFDAEPIVLILDRGRFQFARLKFQEPGKGE